MKLGLALCAACVALLAAAPLPQSALVIAKDGTSEYHNPGCPAIADGKGLLALTVAQANGRGLKPHRACHDEKLGARPDSPTPVYLDGARYYHRKDCKKVPADAKKADLEEAGRKFWPCPVCKPPIRKRKT